MPQHELLPKRDWLIPAGLIALSVIPPVAGTLRLVQLGAGAAITPENARFFAAPLPVALHILSALVFCVLDAFQFLPSFRRRKPDWHRISGRLLVPCGWLYCWDLQLFSFGHCSRITPKNIAIPAHHTSATSQNTIKLSRVERQAHIKAVAKPPTAQPPHEWTGACRTPARWRRGSRAHGRHRGAARDRPP